MSYDWTAPARNLRSAGAWRRLHRGERCVACGRPDWCMVTLEGDLCRCMRVMSPDGSPEHGWIHRTDGKADATPIYAPLPDTPPALDCAAHLARYNRSNAALAACSALLGVPVGALRDLDCAWAGERRAWAFPMRNAIGEVVGIRLRSNDDVGARKWSVTGSRPGLFLPGLAVRSDVQWICEGPTDAAALLGLGAGAVIGRPDCRACSELICARLLYRPVARVVIVADLDDVGRYGAESLAWMIRHRRLAAQVDVVNPPNGAKDAREAAKAGAVLADFAR